MSTSGVQAAPGLLEDYEVLEDRGIVIAQLTDNLDYSKLGPLKKWLTEEMDAGNNKILLNMERVKMLYSAHMGVLVGMVKKAHGNEGDIIFCSLTPAVSNVFRSLDLGSIIKIFDSKEEALDGFEQ